MAYKFTGFFVRPAVSQPAALPQGAVWREIVTPFSGVGVWLRPQDRLLTPHEVVELARQLSLDAADSWVYLTYDCWGGNIDFVYGLGSRYGVPFGPFKEDGSTAAVEDAYIGLMEQFGIAGEVARRFEPFKRGYWGEV